MRNPTNSVAFYGERGLVNSIILDIKDDIEKVKGFLRAIKFCGGKTPVWVDNVQAVYFIIEPSFAEFGDPDLIVVCECGLDERYVVFVEAKVCKYEDSAVEWNKWEVTPGINSRINAQLTLKYRFSLAIENITDTVVENEDVASDYNEKPRKLYNQKVINLCKKYFAGVKDYCFVALTHDDKNVIPFKDPETRPRIKEETWEKICDKFGIVTYDMLESSGVISREAGYYKEASVFLDKLIEDSQDDFANKEGHRKIQPVNWSKFDNVSGIRNALEEIVNSCSQSTGISLIKVENRGSISYKANGKTMISLFPVKNKDNGEEGIMLALRADYVDSGFKSFKKQETFWFGAANKKRFVGTFITDIDMKDDINECIVYLLNRLK